MFLLRWVRRAGILKVGIAVGLAIAPLSANEQQQAQLNNREATTVHWTTPAATCPPVRFGQGRGTLRPKDLEPA